MSDEVVPSPPDDPWSVDYPDRIALAMSILGHASDCPICVTTIDRARLALQGASLDEIRTLSPTVASADSDRRGPQ